MADIVSIQKRYQMMSGIRSKNTKPEIKVRKLLHAAGFRFRLHSKGLPGKPDVVLKKYNSVIFVDGCFWHGHANCHLFRLPKTRTEFWESKISRNICRDHQTHEALLAIGWKVLIVRECALKGKLSVPDDELLQKMATFVKDPEEMYLEIAGLQESCAIPLS